MTHVWPTRIIPALFLVLAVVFVVAQKQPANPLEAEQRQQVVESADGHTPLGRRADSVSEDRNTAQRGPSGQKELFSWPEGITAWAILLTLGAITWQALETRRAAQATRIASEAALKQVGLMEAGMRQWIELEGWKSESDPHNKQIQVSFNLVNPTNFLLTLKHGVFSVESDPPVEVTFVYRQAPLAPNKPLPIHFAIPVGEANLKSWLTSAIGFGVKGEVLFETAMREQVPQRLDGLLTVSHSNGNYLEANVSLPAPNVP